MYNPTEAKEIALEFLKLIGQDPSRGVMARTIKAIKGLMENNYSSDDIRYVMNHCVEYVPNLFSFMYIVRVIDDVLAKRDAKPYQKEVTIITPVKVGAESEVKGADEATERNRNKTSRFGIQSGFRKKSYLDMLKE